MTAGLRIFLVAAEASGDAAGGELMDALRARSADLIFAGVGGPAMSARGVASPFDISELSIIGLVEGLKAYPRVVRRAEETSALAAAFKPDVCVLIDSWGFTLRVAQRLRLSTPQALLVKYIGPQVWATRPGRARTLARVVDHLLCIHSFETPYYTPFGLGCTVVGNPVVHRPARGDAARLRARLGLTPDQRILAVLPGSRRAEITRMAPVLGEAAHLLMRARPDLVLLAPVAQSVREEVAAATALWPERPVLLQGDGEKFDCFAAATAAIATSGTVTTELGMEGAPVVVGYRANWLTGVVAKAILRTPYITLMNVAAGRMIVPEFILEKATPENLAAAAAPLLDDPGARARQVEDQNAALKAMGRDAPPAAEIAAGAILDLARTRREA